MGYQVVSQQLQIFNDADGKPLNGGYIYIGESGKNPETNPINIYWDSGLTISAVQPIRTQAGFSMRNGTPTRIYVDVAQTSYSIVIKDVQQKIIYSTLNSDFIVYDQIASEIAAQVSADAQLAQTSATSASLDSSLSQTAAINAQGYANSALSSSIIAAAYANMEWASFSVTDGELIVSYTSGATSVPSLVDGEFIITY